MARTPPGQRRSLLLKGAIAAVAVAVLAALGLAAFYLYLLFVKPPDRPFAVALYPPEGALVQTRLLTLRWPAEDVPAWQVEVQDAAGMRVFHRQVHSTSVTLPYEALQPGRQYLWRLYPVDEAGDMAESPSVSRSFLMARALTVETSEGTLTVFPARLELTSDMLLSEASLEVSSPGPFAVALPDALVLPDGKRTSEDAGTVIFFPEFDFARAPLDPASWGTVTVIAGDTQVDIPVVPNDASLGRLVAAADSGLDLYRDTPYFGNFAAGMLGRLTRGTCVGVALAVRFFFEHVRYGDAEGVAADALSPAAVGQGLLSSTPLVFRSAASFRDLSEKRPELLMQVMSALHWENLNPLNVTETLKAALEREVRLDEAWLMDTLERGRPAVISGFRLKARLVKLPEEEVESLTVMDSGHVLLAYRGWRFERASFYAVYDPNYQYDPASPHGTVLHSPRGGRMAYYPDAWPDATMVRFLPVRSSKAWGMISIGLQGARAEVERLLETIER